MFTFCLCRRLYAQATSKTYWAADKSSLAECCDHIGKCSGFSCSAVTILKETQPDTCAGTQCTNAEWGEPTVKCTMFASSDTEVLNVDVATQVCASRTCTTKQRCVSKAMFWQTDCTNADVFSLVQPKCAQHSNVRLGTDVAPNSVRALQFGIRLAACQNLALLWLEYLTTSRNPSSVMLPWDPRDVCREAACQASKQMRTVFADYCKTLNARRASPA